MQKTTEVYLIRHSETLKSSQYTITSKENDQIKNEKLILSVNGEKQAERVSKLDELKNVDVLYSSNYVRAIMSAKYIAYENNIKINIDENFNERKLGNLEKLNKLGKTKKFKYTTEQILDENLSNVDGESRLEVTNRANESFNRIIIDNCGKKIVIVSHGALIKFLLLNWCNFNISTRSIEYKGESVVGEDMQFSQVIRLKFDNENKLIDIKNIII